MVSVVMLVFRYSRALASNTSIDRLESLRDIVDESRKAISENFQPIKRSYLAECAMLWQSALEVRAVG